MRSLKVASALLVACAVMACNGDKQRASPARDSMVTEARSTSAAAAVVPSARTVEKRTVLFLGTSLTAGLGLDPDSAYPQLIQRKIDARGLPYQAVNAGVSGETSAGLLRRLDWVLQNSAAVIVVETGANDGLRGQAVTATKATIGQILTRIKRERPDANVLLVQMEAPTNLGREYTKAFHGMFPDLARQFDVGLIPFLLDGVAGVSELNQADGIHPNLAGERKVAENVWKALEPVLRRPGGPLP